MKAKYEDHLRQKDLSQKEKECDKMKVYKNTVVICCDLQQYPCPKVTCQDFTTSKLNVYNFTLSG